MLYSILLNLRRLKRILMSAHRFIRLRNHSHNIVSALYKALEGFHRKLREFGKIRTMTDENGEPLFCAKDVCDILGCKNPITQCINWLTNMTP